MKILGHGWLAVILCMTQMASAEKLEKVKANSAQVHRVDAIPITDTTYLNHQVVQDIVVEEKKNRATGRSIASEDKVSGDFKNFRDEMIAVRDGIQFEKVLTTWVEKLDMNEKDPQNNPLENDAKFMIARMRAFLPMKGIAWRMTPMVHKVPVSQEVLLATLRNYAEQIMINEPDSHVQAQMMYFTMPLPGVKKPMNIEADFITFLLKEVKPELTKSIKTLEAMANSRQMQRKAEGRDVGLYIDTKLRFGSNSFNGTDYAPYERYKAVGYGELFAAIARIHRRIAAIEIMGAYDWNRHFQFRQSVAQKFGIGKAQDDLVEWIDGLPYISGMTRKERAKILVNSRAYDSLYTLVKNGGSAHLANAYKEMSQSAFYLVKAWEVLEKEDLDRAWQLDPELFRGRKEQVAVGIENIKKIFYDVDFDLTDAKPAPGKPQELIGSLSGEKVYFDLKTFMTDPASQPQDLKELVAATHDVDHSEIMALKELAASKTNGISPVYATIKEGKRQDILTMKTKLAGDKKETEQNFRDYLYGRGTGWKTKVYAPLFGTMNNGGDVARKMGILNETRGAKYATMLLTPFIR